MMDMVVCLKRGLKVTALIEESCLSVVSLALGGHLRCSVSGGVGVIFRKESFES